MSGRCFIVGAGEFDGFVLSPAPEDLLIATDGGCGYLLNAGVRPEILIGDMDSIEKIPEGMNPIRYPTVKDDTDMALAVTCGEERGYREFFLYGGLGGRLDHTMANLQLLTSMSKRGLKAYLIGQGSVITAVTDGILKFSADASGMISVFCMGEPARGVYEKGLKYTLDNAVLTSDVALGVSNEFTGQESSVAVDDGTLLVFFGSGNALPAREAIFRG